MTFAGKEAFLAALAAAGAPFDPKSGKFSKTPDANAFKDVAERVPSASSMSLHESP